VLWWRYGARRLGRSEADAVWRALVLVEWLRGRNQPRLWVGSRVDADVVVADPHQLVLSERLVAQVADHQLSDRELCRLVVRSFGLVEMHRSRLVAAVEVFCAPWALLAIVASTLTGPIAGRRLVGYAWRVRWLFVVLAAADLDGRGHWPGLVMLLLVAVATVTTPRWNRAWVARQAAMADRAEQLRSGSRADRVDAGVRGRSLPRPVPGRRGAR
jgi:hypothetical protein